MEKEKEHDWVLLQKLYQNQKILKGNSGLFNALPHTSMVSKHLETLAKYLV